MASDLTVQDSEEEYRDAVQQEQFKRAAQYVATGVSRPDALEKAEEELRNEEAAMNDPTGTVAAMHPTPPVPDVSPAQVAAIKADMLKRAK